MPLLTPNKGETQAEFLVRFMGNEAMVKDYPDEKQRSAIAYSQWRKSKEMHDLKFFYQVPIIETSGKINSTEDFMIEGTAINATVTSNNHKFLEEELRTSANTLAGVPLLVDHKNEVEAIKGRVLSGNYMEVDKKVNFKAKVIDPLMKQMISDGRINSVSVGCSVSSLEESTDGFMVPRGICFKELSLVAVPADDGATFGISSQFTIALKEAYQLQTDKPVVIEKVVATSPQVNIPSVLGEVKSEPILTEVKVEEKKVEEIKVSQLTNLKGGLKMSEEQNIASTAITKEQVQAMITEAVSKAVEAVKQSEVKVEAKAELKEDAENDVIIEKGKYSIVQSSGSLRGGAFTVVRS